MRLLTTGLLLVPIVFNLICLYPETSISQLPLNDNVFHFTASQTMSETWSLKTWLPQSMGYPVWSVYQPGSHIGTALVFKALWWVDPRVVFAWLNYLLISALPLGFYALARALGLSRMGAAAAACLSLTPSAQGAFSRADMGYAGYVWRSWGLYSQLWGCCLGLPAMAWVLRAVRRGERAPLVGSGLALSAAILCHFVFGWVMVVSLVALLALGWQGAPEWRDRLRRGAVAFGVAAPLPALFMFGVWQNRHWVNAAHWGEAWRDASFGAQAIMTTLCNGAMFDYGRWPVLTLLVLVGAFVAARWARPLLILTVMWLVVFFGRATWGRLLDLIILPGGQQAHRAQLGFVLFAILIAAVAVQRLFESIPRKAMVVGVVAFIVALVPMYAERRTYLADSATWGSGSLARHHAEQPDLDALVARLRVLTVHSTGRIASGRIRAWGAHFLTGNVSMSSYLTYFGLPTISFPYHALSAAADSMQLMQEWRAWDLQLFGVRWIVAPVGERVPVGAMLLDTFGRWALYEVPGTGMFDVVQVPFRWSGDKDAVFNANEAWLTSGLRWYGQYIETSVDGSPGDLGSGSPMPLPTAIPPYGRVLSQSRDGDRYSAQVNALRPAYVRISLAYHPRLRALVDGKPVRPLMVTPGFAAVAVPEGVHHVEFVCN